MKNGVSRCTELLIEHVSCGEEFAWIPPVHPTEISKENPVYVKCPKCGKRIKITKYDD